MAVSNDDVLMGANGLPTPTGPKAERNREGTKVKHQPNGAKHAPNVDTIQPTSANTGMSGNNYYNYAQQREDAEFARRSKETQRRAEKGMHKPSLGVARSKTDDRQISTSLASGLHRLIASRIPWTTKRPRANVRHASSINLDHRLRPRVKEVVNAATRSRMARTISRNTSQTTYRETITKALP